MTKKSTTKTEPKTAKPEKVLGGMEFLEQEIAAMENDPKRREDQKAAWEGRTVAARCQRVKQRVARLEKNNTTRLYVFYSGQKWHKMGGNSALFYKYLLAPRIGMTPELRMDRDLYYKFPDGVVSILDMDMIETRLAEIGVKKIAEDPDVTVFELEKPITKEELDSVRQIRKEREERVNQIVGTEELYPQISSIQRELAIILRAKHTKANQADRALIMTELARNAIVLAEDIHSIAVGMEPAETTLKRVLKNDERLKGYLMILMEMGMFEPDEILRIEEKLVDVCTQIKAEIEKLHPETTAGAAGR